METFTNEAIDYLSCRMMEASSGEWLEKTSLITTNAGDSVIALDTALVCVKKVSYLVGNVYQPLVYNELRQEITYDASSGVQQYPSSFYLQGGNIVFDPPLAIGGTNALKIDYTAFPVEMTGSATLPTLIHRAFQHFVAYRAAYTAASSIGKAQKEWADTYGEWLDMMLRFVDKRVDTPKWVKEYDQ